MEQLNNGTIELSILKTLTYAEVFGWVMTETEIFRKSQISNLKSQKQMLNVKSILRKLVQKNKIRFKNDFYFFPGNENLVERRIKREKWAREKFKIAQKSAGYLKIIPTILLVGVSGGLAVGNTDKNDDIDFFIICRTGTLWTTRFFSTLILDFLGRRRRPGNKKIRDKICLNMFVDEKGMVIPQNERDLYTAHEVAQMRVLWDKNGIYKRFLKLNDWVVDYLPNSVIARSGAAKQSLVISKIATPAGGGVAMTKTIFLESFFRWLQLIYMEKKRTSEKIEPHRLMFHPNDRRLWVLNKYNKLLKSLNL